MTNVRFLIEGISKDPLKAFFITCVILGYIAGVGWGLSTREDRAEYIDNCIEWDGPTRIDPREGEGPICLRYGSPEKIPERPFWSFIFSGFGGAWIGGWIGLIPYLFQKTKQKT